MTNFPLCILGGFYGITYLSSFLGLTTAQASFATSVLFLGMMCGSPLAGYLSDRASNRAVVMVIGGVSLAAVLGLLLLMPHASFSLATVLPLVVTLMFLVGLLSGTQVIGYPMVAERASPEVVAMSVSVVNISVMSGQGLVKPFFGWLLKWHETHVTHSLGHPQLSDLLFAGDLLPISALAALLCIACLRSSRNQAS